MIQPQFVTDVIAQMGGPRIFAMAFDACAYDQKATSVTFRLAKGLRRKLTHVRVTVMPTDTYKVEFLKVPTKNVLDQKVVSEIDDVYCDVLKTVVEKGTGLYLSL